MAIKLPNRLLAAAFMLGGAGTTVFLTNHGFASLVRNGAGDYTLIYEQEIQAESCVNVQITNAGVPLLWRSVRVSDQQLDLQFFDLLNNPTDPAGMTVTVSAVQVGFLG